MFIYFDLDDTLLDHKHAQDTALRVIHENYFETVDLDTFQSVYHQINVHHWDLYAHQIITKTQLNEQRFGKTLAHFGVDLPYKTFESAFFEHYRLNWKWVDGAREAFLKIAEKYPVGIITNGFVEQQEGKLERFPEISTVATHVVISEQVGVMKPNAPIFEYAESLSNCSKSDLLMVGDSWTSDIQGALNVGWKAHWYKGDIQKEIPESVQIFEDWQNWGKDF